MSGPGGGSSEGAGDELGRRAEARSRANLVSGLRRLSRRPAEANGNGGSPPGPGEERCDLCGNEIPADHRHLLHLTDRQILCACEACVALRSGDPDLRPTGTRIVFLDDFELSDELWASFQIPIGLAFFLRSTTAGGIVAFYPSPAGSMESELDLDAWGELVRLNPVVDTLDADGEALLVNRLSDPRQQAIVPVDECYRLVGLVKVGWEGISGGSGPEDAIQGFFAELRARSAVA